MTKAIDLGGSFLLPNTSISLNRMGYGAMQLAGPQVWGPPRDMEAAIAVLREAVAAGINHIDTSDFYGPYVTNQIIKKTLHPYTDGLVIVTKVGARRLEDKSWVHALSRRELIDAVHDNLRNLGLDTLDVVNLRVGGMMEPSEGSIEEPLTAISWRRLRRSQRLFVCRTSTIWRTGKTTDWSMILHVEVSPMCRSFR
jgi:pyridoxine 4-dehydrogenase